MMLVLKVFGVIVLLVFLLLAVAFFRLLGIVRRQKKAMREMADRPIPHRMRLVQTLAPQWIAPSLVEQARRQIVEAGYEPAGAYESPEMPGMHLIGFVHPGDGSYGVLYEHPAAGIWTDLVARYDDESTITYNNSRVQTDLDRKPGDLKVDMPGAAAKVMHARLLAERGERSLVPLPEGGFAEHFEKAYAEDMEWRILRGGMTLDEVRRTAAAAGMQATEEQIQDSWKQGQQQAAEQLREFLIDRFVESGEVSAGEVNPVRDRLTVVHDRMDERTVQDLVAPWYDATEAPTMLGIPAVSPQPRQLFANLNESMPPERRFRRLGHLAAPVEADIYVQPEGAAEK